MSGLNSAADTYRGGWRHAPGQCVGAQCVRPAVSGRRVVSGAAGWPQDWLVEGASAEQEQGEQGQRREGEGPGEDAGQHRRGCSGGHGFPGAA